MAIITITYKARCKDCAFCIQHVEHFKNGKIKLVHYCHGPGPTKGQRRAKRDLVCKDWEITM